MPPKAKVKHANQHEKRNDAGLAAPGKRISKDNKSTGSNGHANGRSTSQVTPPLPTTGLNQGIVYPRPDCSSQATEEGSGPCDKAVYQPKEQEGNDTSPADADDMNHRIAVVDRSGSETAFTRDVASLKALASQATSTMSLAVTILAACPMRDAIAILILLLSLPPTLLLVIHSLFISLTLVPPAAGISSASIFTIPTLSPSTWFHGTAGGGPSPFTMMCTDVVMIAIYLLCTFRLRSILMDLAQAVIAISLSGAAVGSGSSTRSIVVCSAIIIASHICRFESFHITSLQYLGTFIRGLGINFSADNFWSEQASVSSPVNHGWPRLILGCHIVAQGLLTLIRRWFAASNAKRQANRLDAEQAALQSSGKLAMLNLDSLDPPPSVVADGKPPGPSPAVRDSKEKVSNSRKKRKQANQVRSQQPLWAAIASTKVTFMKEMEHKAILNDAIETMEGAPVIDGVLPPPPANDRIWVLDIGPTQIEFKAELFASANNEHSPDMGDIVPPSPGIDKQKPFFVRVNGADWGSTRIRGGGAGDGGDNSQDTFWSGEIYGLSPLTKYSCEFVRMHDQHVISCTNLITLPNPEMEQGRYRVHSLSNPSSINGPATVTVPAPPQHQSLRPMSPTSTLKQSIAAAEAKREEVRNKLKRTRKDHKTAASAIRREIDQLLAKVNSTGGQDEKSKQRHLQIQQQIRQTKESTEAIADEIQSMSATPKDELDFSAARRKSYDAALEAKNSAKADFDQTKGESSKELAALQAEISTIAQKRDRLNTRRTKLQEHHERLLSEQNADMTIRQHREQTRAEIREERSRRAEQMAYWIHASRAQAEDFTIRANHLFQQYEAVDAAAAQQPTTPEGNLPGTNGPFGPVQQPSEFPAIPNLMQAARPQPQPWASGGGGRQRSSSMLSGYSGFTDDLDMPGQDGDYGRKGSGGSGSSGPSGSDGTLQWGMAKNGSPAAPLRPTDH